MGTLNPMRDKNEGTCRGEGTTPTTCDPSLSRSPRSLSEGKTLLRVELEESSCNEKQLLIFLLFVYEESDHFKVKRLLVQVAY